MKTRWCDKSITTAKRAEIIFSIYPDAQFICLYRDCMDVVFSLLESSPWGFDRFAVAPYLEGTIGNTVVGLTRYWIDYARTILMFERNHRQQCHRIRYEELVTAPEETLKNLSKWLGIHWQDKSIEKMFLRDLSSGPGDQKSHYAGIFHSDSIGRGSQIPFSLIGEVELVQINGLLRELSYPTIERSWNGPSPLRRSLKLNSIASKGDVDYCLETWKLRIAEHPSRGGSTIRLCKILVEDIQSISFIIDLEERTVDLAQENSKADVFLLCRWADLQTLTFGDLDPAVALDTGRIRVGAAVNNEPEVAKAIRSALCCIARSISEQHLEA